MAASVAKGQPRAKPKRKRRSELELLTGTRGSKRGRDDDPAPPDPEQLADPDEGDDEPISKYQIGEDEEPPEGAVPV